MQQRELDKRIAFEERIVTRSARSGAPSEEAWVPVCNVWASVWDILPSQAERVGEGIALTRNEYDIEIAWGAPVTAQMRVKYRGRPLEIVSGPVEKGSKYRLVLRCTDWSSEGIAP